MAGRALPEYHAFPKCLAQGPPPSFSLVAAGEVSRLRVHPHRAGWGTELGYNSSGPGEKRGR